MGYIITLLIAGTAGALLVWLKTKRVKPVVIFLIIVLLILLLPFIMFGLALISGADFKD